MADMPTLFISHGAPDLLLQDLPASRFLRGLAATLPRPRAIVVASAHWTTAEVQVEAGTNPATIHDFSGFAPELYQQRYAAAGDPALARDLVARLGASGIAASTAVRGFDHGAWAPLAMLYPAADIPVVPLSVQPRRDGAHHLAVGTALAGLRHDGVLVIGSGAMTHNLGELDPGSEAPPAWVAEFEDWAISRAIAADTAGLTAWRRLGPHAARNHPTPEHLQPLLVALGAGGGAPGRVLHRSTTWGVLQMTMLAFG
jgi:4,5-DOPA dioxygenase extradiol